MSGLSVNLEAKVPGPEGWAAEAQGFAQLITDYPGSTTILFICLIIVLILIPGGVGPSWVRYRGSLNQQDQKRIQDIEKNVRAMSKRAKRRQRGKQKAQAKGKGK